MFVVFICIVYINRISCIIFIMKWIGKFCNGYEVYKSFLFVRKKIVYKVGYFFLICKYIIFYSLYELYMLYSLMFICVLLCYKIGLKGVLKKI